MAYLFEVDMLVAGAVFGFAGMLILGLFAWTEAKKCANALWAMQRMTTAARRGRLAILRMDSLENPKDYRV